jgi:hypothetical protein
MIVSTYLVKWTPHHRTNLDDRTSAPPWRDLEGIDSCRMRTSRRIDCCRGHGTWHQIALGKKNWLFAGSFRAGQRADAVMSLLHSARLNGHDVHAYMKDILKRLPTLPASRVSDLLPHRWTPT